MSLPHLPNEILEIIIGKVGEDAFWMLGPFILAGKRSKKLVFKRKVLQSANITSLCEEHGSYYTASDNWPEGKARKFFEKCLTKGNPTALYNEGIRLAVSFNDLEGAVDLLRRNVPHCPLSTMGSALLSICLGKVDIAVGLLKLFFIHHASEGDSRLRATGEEFKLNIYNHGPAFLSSSMGTFQYPDCGLVRTPVCAFLHDPFSDENCPNCFLYWCARSVSRML